MKKRKIFKKITLAGLAVVMAGAGIFAFAPIGASASTPPPTTTTGLGLDPKNDPVVYTTESGLEIRMSNADRFSSTSTLTTNTGYTHTQDLSSFYYFTMGTFSGTYYTGIDLTTTATITNQTVNWIILGVGSHSSAFIDSVSNYLFSTIKNNDYLFSNGEYYFDNQHETYSPAGQLIDSTISAKTYIMGKVKDSIVVNTEIPKGCMLVISEKCIGQSYFNSSGTAWGGLYKDQPSIGYEILGAGGNYGNRYRYMGDVKSPSAAGGQTWNNKTPGSLYTYINNLFSKNHSTGAIEGSNNLGLTKAQADMIVPQQLYTFYSNGYGYERQETPSSDGGTYYTMFPLARRASHPSTYQNFCIEDYLKTNSTRTTSMIGSSLAYAWWLRNSSNPNSASPVWNLIRNADVSADGSASDSQNAYGFGVRPAMVIKLQ